MILDSTYLCCGEVPAKAVFTCHQPGCTNYAFVCGRELCKCILAHADHSLIFMETVVKKAVQPIPLIEDAVKLKKSVGALIDGFIKELQRLKIQHEHYVNQYSECLLGGNILRRKFAHKQKIDEREAVGGSINRMLEDISKQHGLNIPCQLSEKEVEARLAEARQHFSILQNTLRNALPLLRYQFSEDLKHEKMKLTENNSRACETVSLVYMLSATEPYLSMSKKSTIKFRINKLGSTSLGLCYSSIIDKQKFFVENSKISKVGHGTYFLRYNGFVFSHSDSNMNGVKKNQWEFKDGDVITVQLDPSTGQLAFSKANHPPFILDTDIRSETTELVYFCVILGTANDDISIV